MNILLMGLYANIGKKLIGISVCPFVEKMYLCSGKVLYDQLPLNSPRVGRQQG